MEGKRAIRLLETVAFCTGTSGAQARSGGLIVIVARSMRMSSGDMGCNIMTESGRYKKCRHADMYAM